MWSTIQQLVCFSFRPVRPYVLLIWHRCNTWGPTALAMSNEQCSSTLFFLDIDARFPFLLMGQRRGVGIASLHYSSGLKCFLYHDGLVCLSLLSQFCIICFFGGFVCFNNVAIVVLIWHCSLLRRGICLMFQTLFYSTVLY